MSFGSDLSKNQQKFQGGVRQIDSLHSTLGGPDPGGFGPAPQVTDQGYADLRNNVQGDVGRIRDRSSRLDIDGLANGGLTDEEREHALGIGSQNLIGKTTDDLVAQLAGAIYGNQPSVAQGLLQQATDKNMRNALGNATGGVSGGNSILSLQSGIQAAGDANQRAAGDASILRAKEINDATAQLGALIGGQNNAANALRTQQNSADSNINQARANEVAAVNGLQNISNTNAALEQQRKANQGNFVGKAGGLFAGLLGGA